MEHFRAQNNPYQTEQIRREESWTFPKTHSELATTEPSNLWAYQRRYHWDAGQIQAITGCMEKAWLNRSLLCILHPRSRGHGHTFHWAVPVKKRQGHASLDKPRSQDPRWPGLSSPCRERLGPAHRSRLQHFASARSVRIRIFVPLLLRHLSWQSLYHRWYGIRHDLF